MGKIGKIDKLVRGFLQSGDSSPLDGSKGRFGVVFDDIQDPTFLTFKLSFFPDAGYSQPDDDYSAGGLFRPSKFPKAGDTQVPFSFGIGGDAAVDYLKGIGAPHAHAHLESFITMLQKIESEAPWYFQSVTGLADLWKIDPAQNFRAKDKVLTIECLESVDLRMTLLADLYRNAAFDMKYHREILPVNMRTFSMEIHVLEVRRFNSTFGRLADFFGKRPIEGQDKQQDVIDASRKNAYDEPSIDLSNSIVGRAADKVGLNGIMNSNMGMGNPTQGPSLEALESTFEPVSVVTFKLEDCEFDFYSEAPGYLDTVSTKETPEATMKFKIKVGKIEKSTTYSFYNQIISEISKWSRVDTSSNGIPRLEGRVASFDPNLPAYYDPTNLATLDGKETLEESRTIVNSIFPTVSTDPSKASTEAYRDYKDAEDHYRKQTRSSSGLERAITGAFGSTINDAVNSATKSVSDAVGRATGGLLGTRNLGNVYSNSGVKNALKDALNSFLPPSSGSSTPPSQILKNIQFDALKPIRDLASKTVGLSPLPTDKTISKSENFDPLSKNTSITKESFEKPPTLSGLSSQSVGFSAPPTGPGIPKTVGLEPLPPESGIQSDNVFK